MKYTTDILADFKQQLRKIKLLDDSFKGLGSEYKNELVEYFRQNVISPKINIELSDGTNLRPIDVLNLINEFEFIFRKNGKVYFGYMGKKSKVNENKIHYKYETISNILKFALKINPKYKKSKVRWLIGKNPTDVNYFNTFNQTIEKFSKLLEVVKSEEKVLHENFLIDIPSKFKNKEVVVAVNAVGSFDEIVSRYFLIYKGIKRIGGRIPYHYFEDGQGHQFSIKLGNYFGGGENNYFGWKVISVNLF